MRSLEEIQGGNRLAAVIQSIDAIAEAVQDIVDRSGWPAEATDPARDALAVHDRADLSNADRQKSNTRLYHVLIELVGKAKFAGWHPAQYTKGEQLVEAVEFAATGRKLDNGVPAGYRVAA